MVILCYRRIYLYSMQVPLAGESVEMSVELHLTTREHRSTLREVGLYRAPDLERRGV